MDARRYSEQAGFSLLEMLVVAALIAFVASVAIPNLGSFFQFSIKSAARDLASTVKEAYNATLISGKPHRLAYNIERGEFWVEQGPKGVLIDNAQSREKREERTRATIFKNSEAEEKKKSPFKIAKEITKEREELPDGVKFVRVFTEQKEDALEEGTVYTHMFSQGVSETTVIHLVDLDENKMSIIVYPLLGKVEIESRHVERSDVFRER